MLNPKYDQSDPPNPKDPKDPKNLNSNLDLNPNGSKESKKDLNHCHIV